MLIENIMFEMTLNIHSRSDFVQNKNKHVQEFPLCDNYTNDDYASSWEIRLKTEQ